MTLTDGRGELYQWDTGRTLTVDDATITQVQFQNRAYGRTIDVDVNNSVAIIPDEILQKPGDLRVYAFSGTAESGFTKVERVFNIVRRNKPNDYMFTPTEQKSLEGLQKQIGDLSDLKTDTKTDIVAAINETATAGQTLGLTGAIVGQVPAVKAVDENGVPTEWEAADGDGDSKPFVVTVTYGDDGTLTADKTHAEIVAAYAAGAQINAKIVNYPGVIAPSILPLYVNNFDAVFIFSGSGVLNGRAMAMTAQDFNGSWSVSLTELATPDDIPSGGTDTSLGVTGAAVGQLIKIKAVDADGKPTAWEPVDDRLPNTSPFYEGQTLVVKQIGEFEYGYGFARIPNISDFINLGITDASPGKLAKVKFVDDFGQPTAWEAVDMPSGGEREWIKIGEVTNAEDTAGPFYMKFTKDINGNSLSLKGVIIIGTPLFSDTNTHPCALKCNDSPYGSGSNFFLYRSILRNKQTFTIYSEFLLDNGVNSVVVTVSNSGNVKQNGGAESFINTWSPTKEQALQFPIRGIDFAVIDSGLLAGSKFEFWGVKA